MLRIIARHAVHALLQGGQSTKTVAALLGLSRLTVQRIAQEPPVEDADETATRARRGVAGHRWRSECAHLRELLA